MHGFKIVDIYLKFVIEKTNIRYLSKSENNCEILLTSLPYM